MLKMFKTMLSITLLLIACNNFIQQGSCQSAIVSRTIDLSNNIIKETLILSELQWPKTSSNDDWLIKIDLPLGAEIAYVNAKHGSLSRTKERGVLNYKQAESSKNNSPTSSTWEIHYINATRPLPAKLKSVNDGQ